MLRKGFFKSLQVVERKGNRSITRRVFAQIVARNDLLRFMLLHLFQDISPGFTNRWRLGIRGPDMNTG